MTSIQVTDLKAGDGKEKLEGHLKADDFFGTEKFDTATLNFTSVTPKANGTYTVTANLKIKEKTNPVTFDVIVKGNEFLEEKLEEAFAKAEAEKSDYLNADSIAKIY